MQEIQQFVRSFPTHLCMSGGAKGSDMAWGDAARNLGHHVIHWSFEGHRTNAAPDELVKLSSTQLQQTDPFLRRANKSLGRSFPSIDPNVTNLLRRDYYQVAWTRSLYGIGEFKENMINGGTAWAVQLYIDRFIHDHEDLATCQLYFFDQSRNIWFFWLDHWFECKDAPVQPAGLWTGVGTRKLARFGKLAIQQLMVRGTNN